MRVSMQQSYHSMTNQFNTLSGGLQKTITQMATGKRILLPSDDPIAATRISQLNRDQAAIDQYQSNIDAASSSMNQQESVLDSVNNTLLSIRDDLLAVQNDTIDASGMNSYGSVIEAATSSIVAALNYQDADGHYIFGGTVNDKPPIVYQDTDGDGEGDEYVYQGNDSHRETTVSNGVTIDTNVSVGEMFGNDLAILNSLDDLSKALQDPALDPLDPKISDDIQQAIDTVDRATEGLNTASASLGERQNTISMLSDAQTGVSNANADLIGQLQNLDYGPATIEFTGLQMAMEATMKTYAKVSNLSLFNVVD
ncbi:flagellar hook-associated protein FlgL [Atlantibacter hermannii]|uniref:flagellar hook-associated protein FlgL n=1 Tax=Atlantibacter hermannii TaxID=565 RepID=UPI0028A23990|nr:flagellar hook-associated protein FlgL [Atlantibacter hermannii]MDU1952517.1 flagellar hook-associated protein FlgL [Atlantibacter hermannii]